MSRPPDFGGAARPDQVVCAREGCGAGVWEPAQKAPTGRRPQLCPRHQRRPIPKEVAVAPVMAPPSSGAPPSARAGTPEVEAPSTSDEGGPSDRTLRRRAQMRKIEVTAARERGWSDVALAAILGAHQQALGAIAVEGVDDGAEALALCRMAGHTGLDEAAALAAIRRLWARAIAYPRDLVAELLLEGSAGLARLSRLLAVDATILSLVHGEGRQPSQHAFTAAQAATVYKTAGGARAEPGTIEISLGSEASE